MNQKLLPLSLIGFALCALSFAAPPGDPRASQPRRASAPAATPASPAAAVDFAALQKRLNATNEEWRVIGAKLRDVLRLQAEVNARTPPDNARRNGNNNMTGFGDSLESPTVPNFGMAGVFMAGNAHPFAAPPPRTNNSQGIIGGVLAGMAGIRPGDNDRGRFGDMFSVTQGNPVETLLGELQDLLKNPSTPPEQLREKLDIIRATRNKAQADLDAAEHDLLQLLTPQQSATLITEGLLP